MGKFYKFPHQRLKPKLRIRNLLQEKMISNLKMYSIFCPQFSKPTFVGKNFRSFSSFLTFFLSSQSLIRNSG